MKLEDLKKALVGEAIDTEHPDAVQIPLDQAFKSSPAEQAQGERLVGMFQADLDSLIEEYRAAGYEIAGDLRGPGLVQKLEKKLENATFKILKR